MRKVLLAMLVVLGIGLLTPAGSSAAPINGAAIGATQATLLDQVHCVPGWSHHRRGWDGCAHRRVIVPVVPVCRTVRVCGPHGCVWRKRC